MGQSEIQKRLPISAAQLLMVGFRPREESKVLSLVEDGRLGGVILFGRNGKDAMEVARLCERLRDAAGKGKAGMPPIVAVDQEQGRVCRIEYGVTRFPGASVLGKLGRPRTTERVASWVARELSALGINLNLAPVADVVMKTPEPPVLASRTFGSDSERVARHVSAWIRGSQGTSVAACAKHFPGHGGVQEDSHLTLPRDPAPLSVLQETNLRPFSSAIRTRVASILVGHVVYEALDTDLPASMSPHMIQDLLRRRMGFEGLVLTDDLEMDAVADRWDSLSGTIQAIRAGADMAIVGRYLKGDIDVQDLIEGLEEALRKGLIPKDRVASSFRKVMAFKRAWIPPQWTPPSRPPVSSGALRLARKLTIEGRLA
jgi:beta-N-acetylhexosaminidase